MRDTQTPTRKKVRIRIRLTRRELLLLFIILLLFAVVATIGLLYIKERKKAQNPTQIASEEAQRIKDNVSRHILLPQDENPTIATIVDVDKLKEDNSEFYKNAENGDKVLIYSKQAIIYSPTKDIIINVAPVIKEPDTTEQ